MDIYNNIIMAIAVIIMGCYVFRKSTENPASVKIGGVSVNICFGGWKMLRSYVQIILPYRIYLVPAVPVIVYIVWAKNRIDGDTWKRAGIILISGMVLGAAAAIARTTNETKTDRNEKNE